MEYRIQNTDYRHSAMTNIYAGIFVILFYGIPLSYGVQRAFDHLPSLFQGSSIKTNRDFISKHLVINKTSNIPLPEFENANITSWNKTPDGLTVIEQSYSDHMANALAPNSGCEPKPIEVPMPLDPDPYVLTWPTCTPVPRCGGCCGNPMLECAPTAVEDVHLKVLKVRYRMGASRFEYQEFSDVVVQKHTQCSCQCHIKGSDCTYRQHYDEPSCSCKCKAAYKRAGCHSRLKRFDDDTCRCVCHGKMTCDSGAGFVFDENLCRCVNMKGTIPVQTGGHGEAGTGPLSSGGVNDPPCYMRHHCPPGYRAEAVAGTCTCQIVLEKIDNQVEASEELPRASQLPIETNHVPTRSTYYATQDNNVETVVAAPVDESPIEPEFGAPVAPVEFGAPDLGPKIVEDPIPVEQFGGTGFEGFPQQPIEEVLGGR